VINEEKVPKNKSEITIRDVDKKKVLMAQGQTKT
jgi:hypothetical protein